LIEDVAREVTNAHVSQMQVAGEDKEWCRHLMEHLPDSEDVDDLTAYNNRRGMPRFIVLRKRNPHGRGLLSDARRGCSVLASTRVDPMERMLVMFHVISAFLRFESTAEGGSAVGICTLRSF